MAIHMAVQLGLTDDKVIKMAHNQYEQQILQSTWSSINILQSHVHSCAPETSFLVDALLTGHIGLNIRV